MSKNFNTNESNGVYQILDVIFDVLDEGKPIHLILMQIRQLLSKYFFFLISLFQLFNNTNKNSIS